MQSCGSFSCLGCDVIKYLFSFVKDYLDVVLRVMFYYLNEWPLLADDCTDNRIVCSFETENED